MAAALLSRRNRAEREEHRRRLASLRGGSLDNFQCHETVALVERHCVALCVHEKADTAELLHHLLGKLDAKAKKSLAESLSAS